jgi:HYDIN/CFA65/VesB-like, Ig-like domain/Abnormal spindle-like microcephaly-assoc'd, ASPM-SPD-2-Hydin
MQSIGPRDLSFLHRFFALALKTPFRSTTRFRPMMPVPILLLGAVLANAPGVGAQENPTGPGSARRPPGHSALVATPSSASITATVGSSNSQTIQLKNSRNSEVTISSVTVPSGGFRVTGLSTPLTLAGGGTTTLNLIFAPEAAGSVSGKLAIANTSGTLDISISGTGVAASRSISASPTSLSFGKVTVGTSTSVSVTLTSTGNTSVTLSNVSTSGTGFSVSGNLSGTILNPAQTATLNVDFTPTAAGNVAGSVSVSSNATNSPTTIAVSGTGVATTSYSVLLSWSASASSGVTGYNVYRGTTSGGPYSKVDSSPVSGLTYTDTTVTAGVEYYYVVTSLSSGGSESGDSTQVSASIP